MIHSLHLDSFYLTVEQLENSPSRSDGIDKDTEGRLRMYGCELIQEAGILLSFHQVVMATAQVLLHRFYCKRSMKTFNIKVGCWQQHDQCLSCSDRSSMVFTALQCLRACLTGCCCRKLLLLLSGWVLSWKRYQRSKSIPGSCWRWSWLLWTAASHGVRPQRGRSCLFWTCTAR